MVILGLDPGKVNFGYSVIEINDSGGFRVLETGTFKNTIQDLKSGLYINTRKFKKEVYGVVFKYGVRHVVGERFVSRGLLGSLSEYVNIMLGICGLLATEEFVLMIPARWKNALKRKVDIEGMYKRIKVTKHEIDATLIAVYYADLIGKKPFYDILLKNLTMVELQIWRKSIWNVH